MKTAVPKVPRRQSDLNALVEPFFCPTLEGSRDFWHSFGTWLVPKVFATRLALCLCLQISPTLLALLALLWSKYKKTFGTFGYWHSERLFYYLSIYLFNIIRVIQNSTFSFYFCPKAVPKVPKVRQCIHSLILQPKLLTLRTVPKECQKVPKVSFSARHAQEWQRTHQARGGHKNDVTASPRT